MRRMVTVLAAALAAGACFDGDEPAAPNYEFAIEVFPVGIENLPQESFVLLEATVTNLTTGTEVPEQQVVWRSDDPDVAAIDYVEDDEGNLFPVVVGVTPGETIIRASFRNAEEEIPVEVIADPVTTGTLTAEATTAFVGEEIELEAVFRNAAGIVTNRPVEFSSSDEEVAEVDEDGVVTITGPGTATITATSEEVDATIQITGELRPVAYVVVTPDPAAIAVGETQAFTARLFAANDEELEDREIVWSSSNTSFATVNASTGVATGVAPTGTNVVLITATAEGVSGSARLIVDPAP